jgi:hypothetical protein
MSLADGRTRELAKGVRSVDHFSRDGDRVALEPPPGSRGPIVTFDLTTGRECGSRPFPPPAGEAPRPGAPQPGGYRVGQVMSWAYLVYRYRPGTDPGTESTLVLRPGGQRFPLPRPGSGRHWYTYVLPDVPSETLLVWECRRDEKGYHRVVRALRYRDGEMGAPLATDAIFSFEVPGLPFTILIARDRRAMLVDLRTATVRPLPELAGCRDLVWSKHARYFLARLAGRYRVGELDSDGTVRLRPDLFPALGRMPDWFDGEAAILVQWGTSRLTVVTADGHRRSLTPVKQR